MTHAMPLWTISTPRMGSWKWIGMLCLIALLAVSMTLMGCNFASATAAIEADVPVILQMITNITALVAPGVSVGVAMAGGLALASLQVLCGTPKIGATECDPTSLVGQYKTSPNTTILQKIDAALSTVNVHINAMLAIAKGLPAGIASGIVTAIGIALATVTSLMSLMPAAVAMARGNQKLGVTLTKKIAMPLKPGQLKDAFNTAIQAQYPTAVLH